MTHIVPAQVSPELCFVAKGQGPVNFAIVAYQIDDGSARPVCYPTPPAKARILLQTNTGYQDFDLATGLVSGPKRSDWKE